MSRYVEIVVNIPQVTGVFHYHLPAELESVAQPGHLVKVPFGEQQVQGVVLRYIDTPSVAETRPVLELIDPQAVLTATQLSLAQKMSAYTLASLAACISLMLPPGLAQQADVIYTTHATKSAVKLTDTQLRLLKLLHKRGPLRGAQIDHSMLRTNWRAAVRPLIQRGLISTQSILPPPTVQPKYVRTAQLACPPQQAERALPHLATTNRTAQLACLPEYAQSQMDNLAKPGTKISDRLQAMLRYLIQKPGEVDVSQLYRISGGNLSDINRLVSLGLVQLGEKPSPALLRRQAMLRYLMHEAEPVDVSWLYAESGGNLADLYSLFEQGLIVLGESEVLRDPLEQIDYLPLEKPILTQDQKRVWQVINEQLEHLNAGSSPTPILLHGVTGAGKTELYLRAVESILQIGKQAIVLVPEIALTPQTVRRFAGRFPGQVGMIHSRLSTGERYDTWRRARAGELDVVIGPRSALFIPFADLGLIVVDECHDDSYYQFDPEPRYHARQAAIWYAQISGALCILGSATPDIVSYYRAQQAMDRATSKKTLIYQGLPGRILAHHSAVERQIERLNIQQNQIFPVVSNYRPLEAHADSADLPPVSVVDMREELKAGNRSIFSRELESTLGEVLNAEQQAILFLNRRGSATYVFCRDCGHSIKCPRCDLPLTFHNRQNALHCHHCNYQRKMPAKCPVCDSLRIRQYGTGTERVEAEVQAKFPQARTLRWDYETTRTKGAHDIILSHFSAHRADVLIGTQMLAKGLDLPLVTLVGVVLADVGLNLPDYRAPERTFQVLTQVSGRAGRSPLGGRVILQTFQPDNYIIQTAARHDYQAFYRKELEYRRRIGYPPFSNMLRLEYRDADPEEAARTAQKLAAHILEWIQKGGHKATSIIGPAPCFFSRIGGLYRWHIILRGPDPKEIVRNRNLEGWKVSVDPPSLL